MNDLDMRICECDCDECEDCNCNIVCERPRKHLKPIWTFSRLVAITDANTFTFFVCDCDLCNDDCCTYSVVATVAGVATVGVTAINNATLAAIIVDNDCF